MKITGPKRETLERAARPGDRIALILALLGVSAVAATVAAILAW